jgi:hypothetical protein
MLRLTVPIRIGFGTPPLEYPNLAQRALYPVTYYHAVEVRGDAVGREPLIAYGFGQADGLIG